ncbi:MAG: OmpA family protein [Deltaproteobacteria bacterium]|nr:OmpA family protein [Deltaproteobacteria bacterium]MBI3386114.1 OmpA family protein [Deltaproteobacteria bacterium]
MRRRSWAVILIAALLMQSACATMQKPSWNKPVGKWTWISAAVCGAAGAGGGYAIADNIPGHSCATTTTGSESQQNCVRDDHNYAAWTVGLGAGMAVLCGIAGYLFLDPGEQVASAPPPPPAVEVPPPGPPITRKRIVLRGITFDFNKSIVRAESSPVLDEARNTLLANPGVKVVVEGYTDSIGSDEYNQALSIRRAEAVYRYLVNGGVPPEQLSTVGFGKTHPVADNSTDSGRAQNRRVELRVE